MLERITQSVRSVLNRRGLTIEREFGPDVSPETIETARRVRPYTMTSNRRIQAVCDASAHIVRHNIRGAIVESGVWKGGSSMAAALTLVQHGVTDRDFYMYDTYAGIPAPGREDALIGSDHETMSLWWSRENSDPTSRPWLDAPVESVRQAMASTGYEIDRVHLIKGLVEETIPATAPHQVALLRLDTDWYRSTKVELEVLFPRLSPGGILIIDDYGFTTGARQAVDEYFANYPDPIFLHRIDSAARLVVKPVETTVA